MQSQWLENSPINSQWTKFNPALFLNRETTSHRLQQGGTECHNFHFMSTLDWDVYIYNYIKWQSDIGFVPLAQELVEHGASNDKIVGSIHGFWTLFLEIHCPAEFSFKPKQSANQGYYRWVWWRLKLNSAGQWTMRARVEKPALNAL